MFSHTLKREHTSTVSAVACLCAYGALFPSLGACEPPERMGDGIFSVYDYGATGTGKSNDTAAIQKVYPQVDSHLTCI